MTLLTCFQIDVAKSIIPFCGLIYFDFALIVNSDKLIGDQRRLIVRHLYLHGGVIPARPTSNVSKQLYDVLFGSASIQLTILRRPDSLLTWTTIFFANILNNPCHVLYKLLPNSTEHTYNLRPRRHSLSLTVKTNCNNFINRLLFSKPSIYIDGWLYGMSMTSVTRLCL